MRYNETAMRRPAATVLLLAALLGGCTQAEPEAEEIRPFVNQQVDVAVPTDHGFADSWELPLVEWGQQTGAEALLVEYGSGTEGLTTQSAEGSVTASGLPAVIIFPATELVELVSGGQLSPMSEEVLSSTSLDWLDVFEGLREKIVSSQKRAMAVPTACPVLVCYYRSDLLDAAGLAPPKTWSQYAELVSGLAEWAPGKTAVEPWSAEFRATMFLARAAPYAQHPENFSLFFDVFDDKPLIDSPGFVRALEGCSEIWPLLSEQVAEYSPADCRGELLSGRAAIGIAYETDVDSSTADAPAEDEAEGGDTGSSDERDVGATFGFCRLPGTREVYDLSSKSWVQPPAGGINQVTLTAFAGWMAGVSVGSSESPAAAWNLLSSLTAPDASITFPPGTRSLCRYSQVADVSALITSELTTGEAQSYGNAVAESLSDTRVVAELPMVGRVALRRALTQGLTKVLEGTAEPEVALQGVAAAWREISDQTDSDRLMKSYRQSLGLRE